MRQCYQGQKNAEGRTPTEVSDDGKTNSAQPRERGRCFKRTGEAIDLQGNCGVNIDNY